jgi:hypothetical protein
MAHVQFAMRSLGMHPVQPSRLIARTNSASPATDAAGTGASASTTPSTTTPDTRDAGADFRALFTIQTPLAPATNTTPAAPAMAPTAQSLFGANPWMSNPGGIAPNGVTYNYNPYYFATAETAAKVAQMVGGTVVQSNALTPYGPFQQNQPNYMVQLPNGRQIYAGLFASFYDHGYTQDYLNKMVASEISDTGIAGA